MYIYVYFDSTFSFIFYYTMNKHLPKYGTEVANERITICVTRKTKALWDQLTHNERVKLPQITREFLEKTLPTIAEQLKNEHS